MRNIHFLREILSKLVAMLLRFVVSNFLSFAEEVEFNMFPGNFKIHKNHIYRMPEVDLLKTAAIYGANGSGKSNFVKALDFLQDIVLIGNLSETNYKRTFFKLDKTLASAPTNLEVEFKASGIYYAYGVSILNNVIESEWLYKIFPGEKKDELIFERETKEGKTKVTFQDKLLSTEKERLRFEIYAEELSPSASIFTKVKEKIDVIAPAYQWFVDQLWIVYPESKPHTVNILKNDPGFKSRLNEILLNLDTGLAKIETRQMTLEDFLQREQGTSVELDLEDVLTFDDESTLEFEHNGGDYIAYRNEGKNYVEKMTTFNKGQDNSLVELELEEQSDGTQRIIELMPGLLSLKDKEVVLIVDEIERSLHPSMIKEFLDVVLSQPTKGQLIFTTHESYLLDLELFRQDEIWFTEKSKEGATAMYSLSEFKPRYDLDIRKGYLAGRFGAIPFLGNLKDLKWHHAEEQGI